MKIFKKLFGANLITSFLFLILGLFLVFRTEGTISLIASVFGIILLLNGGLSLIKYFKNSANNYSVDLVYGIVAIIAGFVLILNPGAIISILPFVLGIYFTITGIIKLKYAFDIKKYGQDNPIFMIITASLTTICGVLFVINPFGGAIAITQIIGIFLLIYSVSDIINYFILRKSIKIIEDIFR